MNNEAGNPNAPPRQRMMAGSLPVHGGKVKAFYVRKIEKLES